jgi:hypothetical protein
MLEYWTQPVEHKVRLALVNNHSPNSMNVVKPYLVGMGLYLPRLGC